MKSRSKGSVLVGVIPLTPTSKNLGMPWPNYLQPIAENYCAVERAVYECALAGCKSIWIVCGDDTSSALKYRLGDRVLNPDVYEHWDFIKNKADHKKYIPIFYVPLSKRDALRRGTLGWSILHGALTAFQISNSISSWAVPSKYYVAFSEALYDPAIVRGCRREIKSADLFSFSYRGKTIQDGLYTGFTLDPTSWLATRKHIKNLCTGGSRSLKASMRFSSQNFSLDKIFNNAKIVFESRESLKDYCEFVDWSSLEAFYKSSACITRPPKNFIGPHLVKNKFFKATRNSEINR